MPIPQFHEIFVPLLRRSADGREHALASLRGPIADNFRLTDGERVQSLPSSTQSRFVNRLCCAKIHRERIDVAGRQTACSSPRASSRARPPTKSTRTTLSIVLVDALLSPAS